MLQEVFAASYNALLADERPINARPWLYRIARNRCLNHLRRPQPAGQDSMDVFERDGGTTTADTVHQREEFRQIVSDVGGAPRDPAHRAAPARDRRSLLRPDRRGDGHDRAERQVAARSRPRLARGGGRSAAPHLRGGPARARPGGRGARSSPRHPCGATCELRPLPDVQGRASQDLQGARGDLPDRPAAGPEEAVGGQGRRGRRPSPRPPPAGAPAPAWPPPAWPAPRPRRQRHHRRRRRFGRIVRASKAAAGMAAAVIVTAGAPSRSSTAQRSPGPPAPVPRWPPATQLPRRPAHRRRRPDGSSEKPTQPSRGLAQAGACPGARRGGVRPVPARRCPCRRLCPPPSRSRRKSSTVVLPPRGEEPPAHGEPRRASPSPHAAAPDERPPRSSSRSRRRRRASRAGDGTPPPPPTEPPF